MLRFVVARELGRTFYEVAAMDMWELAHWAALIRIEPPLERTHAVESAYTRLTIAQYLSGDQRLDIPNFMLQSDKPQRRTPAATPAIWKAWATA